MNRKVLFFCLLVLFLAPALFAGTNCPPATLAPNPKPIAVGSSPCLVEADWVNLGLNEVWSKRVHLKGGQSYWFSVSKCARAYAIAGGVQDAQGKVIKFDSGSEISFCFKAPEDGSYNVSYRVTGLNRSYSYAITSACLSESNCGL